MPSINPGYFAPVLDSALVPARREDALPTHLTRCLDEGAWSEALGSLNETLSERLGA